MKTVVFGITGGIAAYKLEEVLKECINQHIAVEVIMTDAAKALTTPESIEKIIGKKVYGSLFDKAINREKILKERSVEHISLAGLADCLVIAPATANVIAKLAHGIADDYLTTVVLAATCPTIIFPSMNVHMWEHPLTQENIKKLRSVGYLVFEPDSGMLACGYEGRGKLPKPEHIVLEINKLLQKTDQLAGKKIIITAGATKEPIDDIRFITNHASGKMGASLADALYLAGAEVVYVHAENAAMPRYQMRAVPFVGADDLEQVLRIEVPKADALFHTAAISDFSIEKKSGKISSAHPVSLLLIPRKKILSQIKQWNPDIFLVGFKAEAGISEKELIAQAQKRMEESGADVMIANEVGKKDRGFAADMNEVILVWKNGRMKMIPLASKREIAEKIVALLFGK